MGNVNRERQIKASERQRQALEMRKAGLSYAVIAARLGYKRESSASSAVTAALKKTLQEPADELRKLEVERLDAVLLAIWSQVTKGSLGAIDRYIKVSERRARLLGLDTAAHDTVINIDYTTFTMEQLTRVRNGEDPLAVLASTKAGGAGRTDPPAE